MSSLNIVGQGQPGIYSGYGSDYSAPTGGDFANWANNNLQGGFDAWKQRQFSSAPFTSGEVNSGMALQPGGFIPQGLTGMEANSSQPWKNPSSWDPRQALQGAGPYQNLLNWNGMGPSNQARTDTSPAMNYLNQALSNPDPLGVGGMKNLIEQRGLSALRQGGEQAQTQLGQSFGGVNAAASPEGMALARSLLQQNQAAGIGNVEQAASAADMQAKQANAQFQQGAAQGLANLGLGLGGLANQGLGQELQATQAAGQMQTSANNTWADLMGQLLGRQIGTPWSPAQPIAPGQMEPYPYPGAPGTYTGGQNADPFSLWNAGNNAERGAGPGGAWPNFQNQGYAGFTNPPGNLNYGGLQWQGYPYAA